MERKNHEGENQTPQDSRDINALVQVKIMTGGGEVSGHP